MKSRIRIPKKSTREQTPDFSATPVKPVFQSRPFVVQSKSQETSQQPDLRTQLMRDQRYGHHIGRIQPANRESSSTQNQSGKGKLQGGIIQAKRLYKEMPGNARGTDSVVWNFRGQGDVHATSFPDSQQFSGMLGYKYISNRWVSSYHITRNGGQDRAYYTDEGVKLRTGLERGKDKELNAFAQQYQTEVDQLTHYTDQQATVKDAELAADEQSQEQAEKETRDKNKTERQERLKKAIKEFTRKNYKLADTPENLDKLWFAFYRENKFDLDQENWGVVGFSKRFINYAEQLKAREEERKERLKRAIREFTRKNYKLADTPENLEKLWSQFFEANKSDLDQENWRFDEFKKRFEYYAKQLKTKDENQSRSSNQEAEKEAELSKKRKNQENSEDELTSSTKKRDTGEKKDIEETVNMS